MSLRVLVVDDEAPVRTALQVNLGRRGWTVDLATRPDEALAVLRDRPVDVVLTDVRMPGGSGLDLLEQVRTRWPDVPVVVMTGYGSVEDAVAAMKAGASDYLVKPVQRDALYVVLDRVIEQRSLRAELTALRREVADRYGLDQLVGTTPAMLDLYDKLAAVAPSDATVLLQGPTGTGKELLAHALHYRSNRASGPFIRVNCTAIPEALLESELFGHEKGAFTGAVRQHLGRFEQADGGTLFLDEIGEIGAPMQAKLLRVLEAGDFQRVGGSETLRVDVRVVAATNRDLRREVADGRFREDLFYRLNVVPLRVPPLTARRDDIPLLLTHFIEREAARTGRTPPRIPPEELARLKAYDWPGNVRQLEHAVERAMLLQQGSDTLRLTLPDDDEPHPSATAAPAVPAADTLPEGPLPDLLDAYERAIVLRALDDAGGVQAEAARRLGLSRSNLHYRIKRLGITRGTTPYD